MNENTELPHEIFEYAIAIYTGYTLEYIRDIMSYKDYEVFSRLSMMNFASDSTIKSISAGITGGLMGGSSGGKKTIKKRVNYMPTQEEMKKDNENPNVAYARSKGAKK